MFTDGHPTSTAGDGRRQKTGTPKPGDPVDKKILCAQCGFFFDEERDVKGDSLEADSVTTQSTTIQTNSDAQNLPIHLRDIAHFSSGSRVVSDPVVNYGCPFCGTLNPTAKGRYPDLFAGLRDRSNEQA